VRMVAATRKPMCNRMQSTRWGRRAMTAPAMALSTPPSRGNSGKMGPVIYAAATANKRSSHPAHRPFSASQPKNHP
jgi:hypothetical protein